MQLQRWLTLSHSVPANTEVPANVNPMGSLKDPLGEALELFKSLLPVCSNYVCFQLFLSPEGLVQMNMMLLKLSFCF